MELIIKNINNLADRKLFIELAKRLGLKAELVVENFQRLKSRKAGSMSGLVNYMTDDFDAPLDDFKEYM